MANETHGPRAASPRAAAPDTPSPCNPHWAVFWRRVRAAAEELRRAEAEQTNPTTAS